MRPWRRARNGRRHTRRRTACLGPDLPEWLVPIVIPTPYPVGPITVYLLRGDPLTLVDTGPPTRLAWAALVAGLKRVGVRPADCRRVVVTHGHHDHFGQASRLADAGAVVHAHPHDGHHLRMERRYALLWCQLGRAGVSARRRAALLAAVYALDRSARPVARFTPLADDQRLDHEHGEIVVHHLPGHSPGHVALELPAHGLLLSGDVILEGITPNAVIDLDPDEPSRPFLALAAYRRSLARLDELAEVRLLPAHGPCLDDVRRRTAWLRRQQDERSQQILAILGQGEVTAERVIASLFPRLGVVDLFLAYSEVIGHLLELERRHEAWRHRAGRVELWARSA